MCKLSSDIHSHAVAHMCTYTHIHTLRETDRDTERIRDREIETERNRDREKETGKYPKVMDEGWNVSPKHPAVKMKCRNRLHVLDGASWLPLPVHSALYKWSLVLPLGLRSRNTAVCVSSHTTCFLAFSPCRYITRNGTAIEHKRWTLSPYRNCFPQWLYQQEVAGKK